MSEYIREIDASSFDSAVLETSGPVVVDFYSTECPPCEALAPKYEAVGEVYGSDARFVKIFRQGNRELAESLGVRSSPTVLFYKDGVRQDETITGAIKRSDLERNVERMLDPEKVAKLALIYACAAHEGEDTPQITIEAENWAIKLVNYSTRLMLQGAANNIECSKYEADKLKVWRAITNGMSLTDLQRKTQWLTSKGRREILDDLVETGAIKYDEVGTKGRKKALIHKRRATL